MRVRVKDLSKITRKKDAAPKNILKESHFNNKKSMTITTTKKLGIGSYWYFKRNNIDLDIIREIDGKTWNEAASILNVSIPSLFIFLSHLKKAGVISEVEIK